MRARSIRRIAALACIAASTGATSAQAALPPHVRAPTHVTVGERVTLNLSTFRPGTTVAVQLTPTAHLGGNCCGVLAARHRHVGATGNATLRFTWPAAYTRRGADRSTRQPWARNEAVTIDVYDEHDFSRSARASTIVSAGTPAAPPPPSPPLGPAPEGGTPLTFPDPPADAIEQRFRPHLRFDSSEPWRPLSIVTFFGTDKPRLCTGTPVACKPQNSPGVLNAAASGHLDITGNLDDETSYRSADPACHADGPRDCQGPPQAGIYVHTVLQGGYRYLDYWVFYRFNHAPFRQIYNDEHEGDWEGLTVAVPAADPDPQRFDYVAFAAHAGVYRYLRDALRCGPVDDACRPTDTSVNAYVANGTHATYPQPCRSLLCRRQTALPLPENGFDGEASWLADAYPDTLHRFGSWTYWPGNWNSADIEVNSPARQRRFSSPADTTCTGRFSSGTVFDCARAQIHGAAASPDVCSSWLGPFVTAAACDPVALGAALQAGALGQPGALHVTRPGAIAASAPGVAQLVGDPLTAGQQMTLTGTGADGVKLLVHAQTESELITGRFDDVVLADGEQATVTATTARGAPGLTLTSSQGTMKPTILARTSRSAPPPLRRVKARRRGAYVYITVRGSTRSAYLQLQRGRARGLVARRTLATPAARTITVRLRAPGARYVRAVALDEHGRPSATRLARISR